MDQALNLKKLTQGMTAANKKRVKRNPKLLNDLKAKYVDRELKKNAQEDYKISNEIYPTAVQSWMDQMAVQKVEKLSIQGSEIDLKYELEIQNIEHESSLQQNRAEDFKDFERDLHNTYDKWLEEVKMCYQNRINLINNEFCKQAEDLKSMFMKMWIKSDGSYTKLKNKLSESIKTIESSRSFTKLDIEEENKTLCEIVRQKRVEIEKNMEEKMNLHLKQIYQRYEEEMQKMRENAEEEIIENTKLLENDQVLNKQIEKLKRKVSKYINLIEKWKKRCSWMQETKKDQNIQLSKRVELLQKDYNNLQFQLQDTISSEKHKLLFLISSSQKIIKVFQDYNKCGEEIIRIAEKCRNLQTYTEQILFYDAPFNSKNSAEDKESNNYNSSNSKSKSGTQGSFDHFFEGYNKILIEIMALKEARKSLLNAKARKLSLIKTQATSSLIQPRQFRFGNPRDKYINKAGTMFT